MRLIRVIVKWVSLLMLLLCILGLAFTIMMRGMMHSNPPPTVWNVCVDVAPAIFFFSYIFWFTTSRRNTTLRAFAGVAAVGWLAMWMALSKSFPDSSDPVFWFWICVFAPFVLYWLWVVCFLRRMTPPNRLLGWSSATEALR